MVLSFGIFVFMIASQNVTNNQLSPNWIERIFELPSPDLRQCLWMYTLSGNQCNYSCQYVANVMKKLRFLRLQYSWLGVKSYQLDWNWIFDNAHSDDHKNWKWFPLENMKAVSVSSNCSISSLYQKLVEKVQN